jgi:hypothetical protein
MAANNNPIFSRLGDIQWSSAAVTAANTAKDGTGTVTTIFTADATEGGYVERIRVVPVGTNVATVARLFINNGSTNATPANNTYFDQISLPATTNTETAALSSIEFTIRAAIPAGYKLNVVLGTAVAAGWAFTVIGGKY